RERHHRARPVHGGLHFAAGLGEGLAHLQRDLAGDALAVLLELLAEALAERHAIGDGRLRPRLVGAKRAGDDPFDLGRRDQTPLFFLLSRFKQQQDLFQQDLFSQATVSDYLFAKDRIFASITLDPNELALYERVYQHLGPRVMKPDLVIYLQARLDVLLARI